MSPSCRDVEQADLDLAGEVGQLVDREDAAVGARHEPVVDGQLVREPASRRRRLDRIDVADHVGDGHVRRREFLDIAHGAIEPRDGQVVSLLADAGAARGADRGERIVVDVAVRHDRDRLVEQLRQSPDQPRLRLAAQAQQHEVVLREDGVGHLRDDRVVVTDDAGKERFAGPQPAREVVTQLALDAAAWNLTGLDCLTQASQGGGQHPPILPESSGPPSRRSRRPRSSSALPRGPAVATMPVDRGSVRQSVVRRAVVWCGLTGCVIPGETSP